jgi:hypothetical protein
MILDLDLNDELRTWAFDETGERLALGDGDGGQVVDTGTGKPLWEGPFEPEHEEPGLVTTLAFAPGGDSVLITTGHHTGSSGSNDVYLLDLQRGKVEKLHLPDGAYSRRHLGDLGDFSAAGFLPGGQIAVVVNGEGIHLIPISPRDPARSIRLPGMRSWDNRQDTPPDHAALAFASATQAALVYCDHVLTLETQHRRHRSDV